MLTIGVDVASSPAKTAVCRIEWRGGRGRVVPGAQGDVSDDDLRALAREADKVGLDVPLGWPDAFVHAISRHRDGEPLGHRRRRSLAR